MHRVTNNRGEGCRPLRTGDTGNGDGVRQQRGAEESVPGVPGERGHPDRPRAGGGRSRHRGPCAAGHRRLAGCGGHGHAKRRAGPGRCSPGDAAEAAEQARGRVGRGDRVLPARCRGGGGKFATVSSRRRGYAARCPPAHRLTGSATRRRVPRSPYQASRGAAAAPESGHSRHLPPGRGSPPRPPHLPPSSQPEDGHAARSQPGGWRPPGRGPGAGRRRRAGRGRPAIARPREITGERHLSPAPQGVPVAKPLAAGVGGVRLPLVEAA